MQQAAVIGLGDMGSGLAKNLIASGFSVKGFDLLPERVNAFQSMGGVASTDSADAGRGSTVAFVMVMNGDEVKHVVFGPDGNSGLRSTLEPGAVILLTATVHAREARELAADLEGSGILLVDSPVSGGYPGAQSGSLTMMAAGSDEALELAAPAMNAVSSTIHRVGQDAGMGQTMKACLQSIIGAMFSSVFEASALAAKTGVKGEDFLKVVSTSSAGCVVASTALENIINREFEGTGSHINTMYKDLTISLDMAREAGVPLFTAATAMQLFQAGKTRHPDGDNWVVTKIMEEIVGAGLHK